MTNRREFLKTSARTILLGGLVFGSGYLIFREKPGNADACNFDFACKNCKRLSSCNLPEAKTQKQTGSLNSK
jgi:hypothetical protein